MAFERAETAATAERPFGVSLLPARPTVPKNTILEHKAHFATWDALARHTFFFLPKQLSPTQR